MEPILKTVAREYAKRYADLKGICFLFPNKRCITFLRKYFLEYGVITEDLPHILTISEFVSQVSRKSEADRIVQLFTLYNAYLQIISGDRKGEEPIVEFENFKGWGDTVINDFNAVDLALADPDEIFKNVKDYREITSNFLTEEQKEVMKEYFGIEETGDPSQFWKEFNNPNELSKIRKEFINLWQILAPLHNRFLTELSKNKLGTTGSIYREATLKIISKGRDALPYKKLVAVGFNALTEAERTIFKELQAAEGSEGLDEYIDFIWDATGPILNGKEFSASRFVDYNKKHFPMPQWFSKELEKEDDNRFPEIHIISSPSTTGQTKVASEVLEGYLGEKGKKMLDDAEVAVVLPDESLLPNMLFAIPDGIENVNLTMGISLRQTPVASFMALLRRVYNGMRESKEDFIFYSKDLRILLAHPYCYELFPSGEIEQLFDYLTSNHKVSVKLKEIEKIIPSSVSVLSFPSKKGQEGDIFAYLENLFALLINKFKEKTEKEENNQDVAYVEVYREYLNSLRESVTENNISAAPLLVLQLVERMVSSEKIGFQGEPLLGLQIMGTLETRSLDFKHIIILSMNEGIMPRKSINSSFIPETLRKAYGLPPARYAEEIFGYYFYRLISRAEKVTLIYDGRAITGMRGGISRYILQLREFAPKERIVEETWQYRLQNREVQDLSVEKTPEIREMIRAFESSDDDRKNFSASTLNAYRECGIRFFLQNLLNLNSDPEREDYMDSITVGNVLHEVMMDLYMPEDKQKKLLSTPIPITKEKLESILADEDLIRNLTKRKVNKFYYGDKTGQKTFDSGVNEIISEQIEELVKEIVKYDLTLVPFNLYGCEISKNLRVKLGSGRVVNFRFAIDRLDEIEIDGSRRLRIVDYKTGERKRNAKDLKEVFKGGYKSEQIFQLFTYAWLLGKLGIKGWEDVVTEIYYVPDLIKGVGGLPKFGKEEVKSFRPYQEEFSEMIEEMIEGIFENEKFEPSCDTSNCTYCAFKSFCLK